MCFNKIFSKYTFIDFYYTISLVCGQQCFSDITSAAGAGAAEHRAAAAQGCLLPGTCAARSAREVCAVALFIHDSYFVIVNIIKKGLQCKVERE